MIHPRTGSVQLGALVAIVAATLLAAALRLYGLADQVVLDDEWHALLKLLSSSYGEIARSFGVADHSIPLTLLYKAIGDTIGLDEIDMRIVQVACGVALVPAGGWLAWKATRNAPVAGLFATLLGAAPFLVLYSRLARPYSITTLLLLGILAMGWAWRSRRSAALAAGIVSASALCAWLHPLSMLYPATMCVFLFASDGCGPPPRPRRVVQDGVLAIAVAVAMLLPLGAPLVADFGSLWGKAGGQHADGATVLRALALFCGGLSQGGLILFLALAALGAVVMLRRDRMLGIYLLVLAWFPPLLIALVGARSSNQGHTFARYVFPLQLVLLFWASVGSLAAFRTAWKAAPPRSAWAFAGACAALYLAATPTIRQVRDLGAWYGHLFHHFDYDPRYNEAARQYAGYEPPDFYRELARMPRGSVLVIEAPFSMGAPANPFAYFDTFSKQPAKAGLLHDLCLGGARHGEPPPGDPRFRFRAFVFLDQPAAVRASGARFLVLHREQIDGRAFTENGACIASLQRLYGPPVSLDARLAVWDLGPPPAAATLQ